MTDSIYKKTHDFIEEILKIDPNQQQNNVVLRKEDLLKLLLQFKLELSNDPSVQSKLKIKKLKDSVQQKRSAIQSFNNFIQRWSKKINQLHCENVKLLNRSYQYSETNQAIVKETAISSSYSQVSLKNEKEKDKDVIMKDKDNYLSTNTLSSLISNSNVSSNIPTKPHAITDVTRFKFDKKLGLVVPQEQDDLLDAPWLTEEEKKMAYQNAAAGMGAATDSSHSNSGHATPYPILLTTADLDEEIPGTEDEDSSDEDLDLKNLQKQKFTSSSATTKMDLDGNSPGDRIVTIAGSNTRSLEDDFVLNMELPDVTINMDLSNCNNQQQDNSKKNIEENNKDSSTNEKDDKLKENNKSEDGNNNNEDEVGGGLGANINFGLGDGFSFW